MCFYIDSKYPAEQIAKEDISVYKVILRENLSYWQDFLYTPNTLYVLDSELSVHEYYETIDKGFHSYSTLQEARYNDGICCKTVLFTIPKGTKYYYNEDDSVYVSNSIRSGDLVAL